MVCLVVMLYDVSFILCEIYEVEKFGDVGDVDFLIGYISNTIGRNTRVDFLHRLR